MSILIKPIITEKATDQSELNNCFSFVVKKGANKIEVKEAVEAGADIIMLDNMSIEMMQEAIKIIRADKHIIIEVSGNVTIERLPELAKLDIDVISSGALTHSVIAADLSMKFL